MTLLSSLRGRIFLASALLAVLSIAVAIFVVNRRVTAQAQRALEREILSTGALVEQLRTTRTETYTITARLIADHPRLKAAVETGDAPTVQDLVKDYQEPLKSIDLLLVTNADGRALAILGTSSSAAPLVTAQPAIRNALAARETISLLPQPNGILQVITVPISLFRTAPQILGTLSVGFLLNDRFAQQLKSITGSDVAFGLTGRILASTMPREADRALDAHLRDGGISTMTFDGEEYVLLPQRLAAGSVIDPTALILRSRTEQLRSLEAIHTGLAATAVIAVLLATLLSFVVARSITRPLAAITDVMREVASTGDLTRKIALRHDRRWDDEDATLLATTFNTLTDSIARFQREVSQKERLSSLGRLSTVIAHEVRNPLMIIKAALHTLRQPDVPPVAMREAVSDIDGEVDRLNRIVNEVLDFSRPIRFELAPTDLNALCRESAAASQAAGPGAPVHLDLDPRTGSVMTDPERLRIALVNMLVNARHAVNGASSPHPTLSTQHPGPSTQHPAPSTAHPAPGTPHPEPGTQNPAPLLSLSTAANGNQVTIVIADRGPGIDPALLPHVFDPYFTTKRGGTGLGLAIAKNIVEGLGGTIGVTSVPGQGTDIRVDLPIATSP